MPCFKCGKKLTEFNKHEVRSCGDDPNEITLYCTECFKEGLKSGELLSPKAQREYRQRIKELEKV